MKRWMIPTLFGVLLVCFTWLCIRGGGVHVLQVPELWIALLRGEAHPISAPAEQGILLSVDCRTVFDPATENQQRQQFEEERVSEEPLQIQWSVYGPDELTARHQRSTAFLPWSLDFPVADSVFHSMVLEIQELDADARLIGHLGKIPLELPPGERIVIGVLAGDGNGPEYVTDPSAWPDALEKALLEGRPASLWTFEHSGWAPLQADAGEVFRHASTR